MKRTFTLDEASRLIPVVEALLQTAIESNRLLQQAQQELQEAGHRVFLSGGSLLNMSDMRARKTRRDSAANRLRDALAQIDALGVQVKDLEIGLLDFPCKVEEEVILLCWKLGEPAIAYWHTVEDGFKGRRPIDERIARGRQKPS